MRPFEYLEPTTLQEAASLLSDDPLGTRPIAGGTDLLSEIKDGIVRPRRLVSLLRLDETQGVSIQDEIVRLGSGLTIADLMCDPFLQARFPMLVKTASSIATPQIRNVGTLGGNLCQRPRCWYYRHPLFPCYKKGGTICYATTGYNRNLAIFGGGVSFIVHPSDMAPALIALDAQLDSFGPNGLRSVRLENFFASPKDQQLQEHVLGAGEYVIAVRIPFPEPDTRGVYLKARDRIAEDFALVSIAATVTLKDRTIKRANIILGGVAPTPYRVDRVENAIIGSRVKDLDLREVSDLATLDARPLQGNEYKVELASTLVRRALEQIVGG